MGDYPNSSLKKIDLVQKNTSPYVQVAWNFHENKKNILLYIKSMLNIIRIFMEEEMPPTHSTSAFVSKFT